MAFERLEFVRSTGYEDALRKAAAEQRIDAAYWDIFHHKHEVPAETQKRILAAMGWDVQNEATIDAERERRFRENYTRLLAQTPVVGERDRWVCVNLPDGAELDWICFDVKLEDGQQLTGSAEVCQLERVRETIIGDERYIGWRLMLPAETPLGYHRIKLTRAGDVLADEPLILCPEQAFLPERLAHGGRTAGFNVTLYGLRSERNWGCGDFTDLRTLIDWAVAEGFSFIGLNPLHALHNRAPYNTSPYLPLSIFYKNLLYIDIESVPEFGASPCAQNLLSSASLQEKLRAFRQSEFVAYSDIDRIKKRFLKVLFRALPRNPERAAAFRNFCDREGALLERFALYCALDEVLHKQDRNRWTWRDWPEPYQNPESAECAAFAQEHRKLIDVYKYTQFVIDEQLDAAQQHAISRGMSIGLYHDLALATDSCGADLWAYREFFVNGCRVGAPPDDFSPNGQDWAFPPPDTDAHRRDGYRLYRESIRKIVEHGGALRIDHVMRLFRLFWIPEGSGPAGGTYVRDRAEDLMHILALESSRAKSIVVGEDLGTVTDEIRDMLARFRILSYRLFFFERFPDGRFKPSGQYPSQSLVSSSTHDLATLCGFWQGRDIEARRSAGLIDNAGADQQWADRHRGKQNMLDILHQEALLPHWYARDASHIASVDGELHSAAIAFLAGAPSALLLINQEDLTKETEQQNLPGSTAEYPNWQRKMRARLEDLRDTWQPYADMIRHRIHASHRAG